MNKKICSVIMTMVFLVMFINVVSASDIGKTIEKSGYTITLLDNTDFCDVNCYSEYKICGTYKKAKLSDLKFKFKDKGDDTIETSAEKIKLKKEETVTLLNDYDFCIEIRMEGEKYTFQSIDNVPCIEDICFQEFTWWNASWLYSLPINITENQNEGDLINYSIKLNWNTSQLYDEGKINDDCSDFRVTDAEYNEIPYWFYFEDCKTDGSGNSTIWINVPNITDVGTTKIYLYYGNPAIINTTKDITNTFVHGADFTTFNLGDISSQNGWDWHENIDSYSYSADIVNYAGRKVLNLYSTGAGISAYHDVTVSKPVEVVTRIYTSTGDDWNIHLMNSTNFDNYGQPCNAIEYIFDGWGSSHYMRARKNYACSSGIIFDTENYDISANTNYTMSIKRTSGNGWVAYVNGVARGTSAIIDFTDFTAYGFQTYGGNDYVYYTYVREYVENEPTIIPLNELSLTQITFNIKDTNGTHLTNVEISCDTSLNDTDNSPMNYLFERNLYVECSFNRAGYYGDTASFNTSIITEVNLTLVEITEEPPTPSFDVNASGEFCIDTETLKIQKILTHNGETNETIEYQYCPDGCDYYNNRCRDPPVVASMYFFLFVFGMGFTMILPPILITMNRFRNKKLLKLIIDLSIVLITVITTFAMATVFVPSVITFIGSDLLSLIIVFDAILLIYDLILLLLLLRNGMIGRYN